MLRRAKYRELIKGRTVTANRQLRAAKRKTLCNSTQIADNCPYCESTKIKLITGR